MKIKLLILFGLLAAIGNAQVAMTSTTLSAALTSTSRSFNVASATGIVAPSFSTPNNPSANQTFLYVDNEMMFVNSINGTFVSVTRGAGTTKASAHVSGAVVYVGPPHYYGNNDLTGACTSTTIVNLPRINVTDGNIYDCRTSGQWILIGHGTMSAGDGTPVRAFCTGTVGSAETEFLNGAACSGATTATAGYVVSSPGTLASFYISSSANSLGTGGTIAKVVKNGTATTIVCSIAAAAKACSDSTHSVQVVAGDRITFSYLTSTSDTAANISATVNVY